MNSKFYLALCLVIFGLSETIAQNNIEPLFAQPNASDFCVEIIEKNNNDFLFLNTFRNFEGNALSSPLRFVERNELPDSSYSSVYLFSKEGTLKSKLVIESTDSLYYYGLSKNVRIK